VVVFTHAVDELLNNCMNKTALQDIQKTLNIIRNQIDVVDAETKWAALELMLGTSARVAELAKKMIKPKTKTKTVTRTISIPKTKVIKQPAQQTSKTSANDAVRTAIKPTTLQKPLPNQQSS
jgi:hypothetical protein